MVCRDVPDTIFPDSADSSSPDTGQEKMITGYRIITGYLITTR